MYISILFIIVALALIIFISKQREFSKPAKTSIMISLGLSILIAMMYEYGSYKYDNQNRIKELAFKQGKVLICKDKNITNKTYLYEPGTASLMPNSKDSSFVGDIYPIEKCILKK